MKRGIPCAYCGGQTSVVNTISHVDLIIRYRKCKGCGLRTRTEERPETRNHAIYSKSEIDNK